jgi:hypothetical protein
VGEKDIKQVPQNPFHRVENPTTQTKAIAKLQELSREIWGRPARGSGQPSVKAYPGSLPKRRGVEFTTSIEPMPGSAPNEARWYWEWCPGVELRQQNGQDYACVGVTSFNNMQP